MPTFGRIIPVLVYADIPAAHDFLVRVFGFRPGGVWRDDQGRPTHGEVHLGDQTIWLHRVTQEHGMAPVGGGGESGGLVVYVDDVDAHFAAARAAGAVIDSEPRDQAYEQREYGVRDAEGHRWWFASPRPVLSPEHPTPR